MQIAVENFRSFDRTGFLSNSDLNIFIGKNSSGKSSLLRLYPLMKQTLLNKTSEPILWYSPDYVDFGEYEDVLGFDKSKPVTFSYKFKMSALNLYDITHVISNMSEFSYDNDNGMEDFLSEVDNFLDLDIEVEISIVKKSLSKIAFVVSEVAIELNFEENDLISFLVNGSPLYIRYLDDIEGIKVTSRKKNLMNILGIKYDDNPFSKNFNPRNAFNSYISTTSRSNYLFRDTFITPEILKLFSSFLDEIEDIEITGVHNKDVHNIEELLKSILIGDFLFLEQDHLINKFNDFFQKDMSDYPKVRQIINLFIAGYVNDFLVAIDVQMTEYFSKVKYIAPLRASVQRYYRLQGIAVSEMDATGANIPMILANMANDDFISLQRWTQNNFKFMIERASTPGHTSIFIKFENEETRNIIDLGFGYSQLLPIIVEIWNVSNRVGYSSRRSRDLPYIVVIEQPELHLHPAMQAEFIDMCIKIIKGSKNKNSPEIKFVIETHSQTIINRISESILKEKFDKNSVSINIVNINHEKNSTVKSIEFDKKGQLTEWPIGFFSPESIKYDNKI